MNFRSSGLGAWLLQRFTAVYLLIILAYSSFLLLDSDLTDPAQLQQLLSNRFVASSLGLTILAILGHGWVGIRDIVMDYVKPLAWRLVIYACVLAYIFYIVLWALHILWNL